MIYGDIRRPLFKVTYRIAPGRHYVAQQLIRVRHRAGGAVNKASLDSPPGLYETRPIACREGLDMKLFDSLCSLFEPGFRLAHAAAFLYGAGVFSATELSPQSFSPPPSLPQDRADAHSENCDERND